MYFITSPSVFRLDTPEVVSLSVTHTNHPVVVHLYIKDRQKRKIDHRAVTVHPDLVHNTTFTLQPSDIEGSNEDSFDYVYLVARAKSQRKRFRKEASILVSKWSGYIFIQTDKPVYTPGQDVKLRVIPLNEMRKPTNASVYIDIKNPQGVIVQRKNASYQGSFITDTFTLPTRPLYGDNWTVEARFTNGLLTMKTVTFEVKEYVLPKFRVGIETDQDIVLPSTDTVRVNITAKYFHGEPVTGSCTLSVGLLVDGLKRISDVDFKLKLISGTAEFLVELYKLRDKFPDYWFPDGARLFLRASVLDNGTGRREQVTHNAAVFTNKPYKISTARSQKYFKPGLTYDLKIDTFYANSKTASYCALKISCSMDGGITINRIGSTDEQGQLIVPVDLGFIRHVTCKITTDSRRNIYDDLEQTEVTLELEAMSTNSNQFIQVKPVLEEDRLMAEVTSTETGNQDYVHLLISGGRIISHHQTRGSNSFIHPIDSNMAPNMKILTYTLATRRHGRHTDILADSSSFHVPSVCNYRELELVVPNVQVSPQSVMTFNVTGAPNSSIGFLAVDKALYQISDKNKMRKEMMMSEFAGHDIGCSTGGGININKVFEDAGLAVITNADVETSQRQGLECSSGRRKKRSTRQEDVTNPCCVAGRNFSYTFGQSHLIESSECYTEGQQVYNLTTSPSCAKAFYRCCMEYVQRLDSPGLLHGPQGLQGFKKPSSIFDFDRSTVMSQDEEYTFRDIDAEMDDVPIRSYFPESWMFLENYVDDTGFLSMSVELPDSITTHVIQAVSLSPVYGMCVAEPADVISTKEFFIDLDLPYSVVRMEQTEIRVALYNYGNKKLPCHIRLLDTEGVCSAEQDKVSIDIEPNDVQLARFPIVPMRAGEFIMDVIVLCEVSNVGDRVRKTLKVVNEGREEKKTVSFWLDPKGRRHHHYDETDINIQVSHPFTSINTQVTTVDLTLPKEAIPGTGKCKVSAIGNIMDAAVQTVLGGVHDLLDNVPHGCGEQTMILMAPLVYAMRYLQGTGRLTPQAEMRGRFFMRVGYQRELSFRKPDGSFSVWQHRASSTWLTAFVMKVFCQAKQYIDIDQNVICSGMEWLFSKQNENGSFTESSPVYHKEIMGGINGEMSMTAFVLISMLECDCRLQGTAERITRAVDFLENQFLKSHHPYSLSISAYALVLANSPRKWRINKKLQRYSQLKLFSRNQGPETGYRYWPIEPSDFTNQTDIPFWYRKPPSSISIETTAYALLTQLALDKLQYSHNIVEWMVEQQQASGAFISTQDTIVGLQALSMYNIRSYAEDVDMRCTVTRGDNSSAYLHLNENEAMVEKSVHDIPATGQLQITTQGSGVARMEVEVSFHVNDTKKDECKFNIHVQTNDIETDILRENQANGDKVCDACGECSEIDFDILLDKYNVPDPNPRIGFSNANINHQYGINRPPPRPSSVLPDVLNIDLTGTLGIGPQGRSEDRGPARRPSRRTRSARRRGGSRLQKCLEICVGYLGNEILDMPVVDVGLPTGFYVEDEDLKKTSAVDFIDSYDVSRGGITFYMEKIPQKEVCFKLRMLMDFEVENLQSAKIEVYDYSKKDERCVKFYSLQYDVADLDVFCSKEECHCVEGECAENYDSKMKSRLVAATTIFDMTCYEYDYVLRVEATSVRWTGNHLVVSTVIHSVINKENDLDDLVVDGEIEFWMNLRCSAEMLQIGHYYIIYGNGGYRYVDETGTKRYRYYLHRDSVVMKDLTRSMYNPDNDSHLNYWQRFFTRMESRISSIC